MLVVSFIFWLLVVGIASSLVLVTLWFLVCFVVAFYKVYCKKSSVDPELYDGKLN